ncbi:hypothetical protein [Methylobacterium sp. W2]|nr:hypothetical protein [Methylobacterium sp. W2]
MRESLAASLARRFLDAVAAAARGFAQAVEGTSPTPQLVPVRVRDARRR